MWFLFFLMVLAFIIANMCGDTERGGSLERSARRAFDSSVYLLSTTESEDEDVSLPPPSRIRHSTHPSPSAPSRRQPPQPVRTVRKRPTPLMMKRVAVRYGFKCAICRQPLDETWETDHIVPLSEGGQNSISNLQPLHRACHQLKSSQEARRLALPERGRLPTKLIGAKK